MKTEPSSDVRLPVVGSSAVKFLESYFFANDLLGSSWFLLNFEVDHETYYSVEIFTFIMHILLTL